MRQAESTWWRHDAAMVSHPPALRRLVRSGAVAGLLALTTVNGARAATPERTTTAPALVSDVLASSNSGKHTVLEPPRPCPVGVALTADLDCSQADTEMEPDIAIDPLDPKNAVAVMMLNRYPASGADDTGVAVTWDGGRSWRDAALPGLTAAVGGPFAKVSDPVVAFGPDGTVYVVSDALPNATANPQGIAVWSSTDRGRTWDPPVIIGGGDRVDLTASGPGVPRDNVLNDDKPSVVVDMTTGRVYVTWHREGPGGVVVAYSDTHGVTWNAGPAGLGFVVDPTPQAVPSQALVLPGDGALAVIVGDSAPLPADHGGPTATAGDVGEFISDSVEARGAPNHFSVVIAPNARRTSNDGPLVFTDIHGVVITSTNAVPNQRSGAEVGFMSAAVDSAGRMYMVWTDNRFRNGSPSGNDVAITSSSDSGLHWTVPTAVNPTVTNDPVDHYDPAVTVAPNDDVIVAFRQLTESPTISREVDTMVTTSHDHATAFDPPTRINAVAGDLDFAAVSAEVEGQPKPFLGDYFGVAATGSQIYVAHVEALNANDSPDCGKTITTECASYPPEWHHQRLYVAILTT